jgi:teichuronic acid exporter
MSVISSNKTQHAFFWSFIEKAGLQGIQFVISIVLARLLLPEQYGLIGMLAIFLAVAQSFLDSGFGSALIQKQDVKHVDECSIFYFNIAIGLLAAGLICLVAPAIARFYHQPVLEPLSRFLSLNIVINSFSLIQVTLLTKRLDFKTQAKISIFTVFLSGPVGIALAYNGFGVWSLAIQQVCGNLARTALLWLFCSWRPSWSFSLPALRQMFAYGSRLLASGLLDRVFENIYSIVIGKLFSAVSLGHYTRALTLQQLPAASLTDIVSRVTFPLFSGMQYEASQLKEGFRKALTTLAFINFPVFVGLALVARPLVRVLLTDKWLPCVPYLQLLAVVGLMYPLHAIHLNMLKAKGRSDLFFRLEVLKKILIAAIIAVTWRFGVEAMIAGQVLLSILAYYLNSYYTAKLLDYSLGAQLKDLLPVAVLSLAMGAAVGALNFLPITDSRLLLGLQIITGAVSYACLGCCFKPAAYRLLSSIFKDKLVIYQSRNSEV